MINKVLLLLLTFSSMLCVGQRKENIYAYFGNLAGLWEMKTPTASLFEEWKIVNDTLAEGTAWEIKDGIKTISEEVRLVWRDGNYYYEPKAFGQNDEKMVSFKQSSLRYTKEFVQGTTAHHSVTIIFANPNHDYPKYILYTIMADKLEAKIGKEPTLADGKIYSYKRVR